MPSLTVAAMGVPVRFEAVGVRPEETIAALRGAWSRCVDLPLLPEYGDADAHVVRVEVLEEGASEVDRSLVHAAALGRPLQVFGEPSHVARHRLDSLLIAVSKEVTMVGLEAHRGRFLLLHAAVLAAPDGRAVAFVGASGAGKTTLCSRLGRSWGYVSDETAVVAEDGTLVPYPKPLSVIRHELNLKLETSPDELGLAVPPPTAKVAGVVLLDRRPGPTRLEPVPAAHAVVELAAQTSGLADLPHPLDRLHRLWAGGDPVGRLVYHDAGAIDPSDLMPDRCY